MSTITAEALLAGGDTTFTVEVPPSILTPARRGQDGESDGADPVEGPATVVLRPLQLNDLQRVAKAAPDSNELSSVLMVQQALVEPALSVEQVGRLHAGLVEFLLGEVNRISGLHLADGELSDAVQAPMARACFTLSREFGWTPDECAQLTIGQVLLYLEMLKTGGGPWDTPTA
ncbi:MAG: hypothetical protein QNJ12_07210 [Ilumatobacter sp.]|uniref:hypothetical protein n=1 Tax=Ilumatobacter sp. TaxID=1967498 RepID=UPI0026353188|nr:hypothetical protein [Ilumatobacter sp.]MDJ0768566.1 hypothetical protein [Ilumatobacter sp.]